jgi:hypothetical protein
MAPKLQSALVHLNSDTPVSAAFEHVGQARLIPPKWVIKNVIPTGLTMYIAPPKNFKSTTLLHWMLRLIGKQSTLLPEHMSQPIHTGTVIMISTETKAGKIKFDAMFGFNVNITEHDSLICQTDPFAFRLDNADNVKELLYWLRRIAPVALVIDPLRNSHGQDENDAGAMVQLVQPLQQYAINNDMALILVHHTKKPGDKAKIDDILDPNMGRGTGALFGLADGLLSQAVVSVPTVEEPDEPYVLRIAGVYKSGTSFKEDFELNLEWARMKLDTTIASNVYNCVMDGATDTGQIAGSLALRETDVLKYLLYMNKNKIITRSSTGQKWEVVT